MRDRIATELDVGTADAVSPDRQPPAPARPALFHNHVPQRVAERVVLALELKRRGRLAGTGELADGG
jgi:hypothetical protein